MRIMNRLRETRLARGYNLRRLSLEAGVARPTLYAIEGDEQHEPNAEIRRKLSEFLRDPGLFWLEGSEPTPLPDLAEVS